MLNSRKEKVFLWSHWLFLLSRQEMRKNLKTELLGKEVTSDPRGMCAEAMGHFYNHDAVKQY